MEDKDVILKVENISKQYRLGLAGTGTISHDLNRFWYKIRGKEDPYLKIGETNDRSTKGESDYVWALKDISFEVKKGEVLGIIGKNGAGKSTLLKILSRVTGPTTGSIKTKGRIASLLEVGTGFHPEMTGRENIYLNGAILGMTKKEIDAKIDEIIEFSGCTRYVDTPVKRYSSGMKVRLAFAVAAFLEPDILVVDEVLAVGDAEFQKKAIGKMQDISSEGGRTVLFVSHNMGAIRSLCTKCLVLKNGEVFSIKETEEAIKDYLTLNTSEISHTKVFSYKGESSVFMKSATLLNDNLTTNNFNSGDNLKLCVKINTNNNDSIDLMVGIYNQYEEKVSHVDTQSINYNINKDASEVNVIIKNIPLIEGMFYINLSLHVQKTEIHSEKSALNFFVEPGDYYKSGRNILSKNRGSFLLNYKIN